jgi:hypothetical protein
MMMNMRPSLVSLLVLLSILAVVNAVKFDLLAVKSDRASEGTKCLAQYVTKDTLVLATVNVGEGYNQRVELEVNKKSTRLESIH